MSNIDKQALRNLAVAAKLAPSWYAVGEFGDVVDPAKPEWKPVHEFCKTFTAARVLALLDELEAKDQRLDEILKPNMLLPVIDDMDEENLRHVIKTVCENYSLLHAKWESEGNRADAAEKRIAELEAMREVFLRAKALMYQSGGAPIENSLNPIDAWLYDAERAAAADKGEAS